MGKKKNSEMKVKALKGVKAKLLLAIIPCVTLAMVLLIALSYSASKRIIINQAIEQLVAKSESEASEIETWTTGILSTLNMIQHDLNTMQMDDDTKMAYLASLVDMNENFSLGVYIGDDKGNYLDATWVPDADYVVTERDWYREGLAHEEFTFGSPYLDENTGEYVVSASTLVKGEAGATTVAAADVYLNNVSERIARIDIMGTGRAFLVDGVTREILAHPDRELIGRIVPDSGDEVTDGVSVIIDNGSSEVELITVGKEDYYVMLEPVDGTDWFLISSIKEDDILSDLYTLRWEMIVLLVLALIVISVVMYWTVHIIILPIQKLTVKIDKIAEGDFTVDILPKGQDEISRMGYGMKSFVLSMRKMMGEISSISSQLNEQAEMSGEASESLYGSASVQSDSMLQLKNTVEELAKSVSEVAENATSLAIVVAETGENGSNARQKMIETVEISKKGRNDMEQINLAMETVQESVKDLEESVDKVGNATEEIKKFAEIIGEIASQTNLLALNAAIEAARAGEAGRGFAVVSEEIGKLADNSEDSARRIYAITSEVNALVEDAVGKTKISTRNINESNEMVRTASATFREIYHTVEDTNEIVQQIIENVQKVDDVATSLAAITEEQSASAEEILSTSENLAEEASNVADNSGGVAQAAQNVAVNAEKLANEVNRFKI